MNLKYTEFVPNLYSFFKKKNAFMTFLKVLSLWISKFSSQT